nr:Unknown Function [uncultured bacterium]AIA13373.1 Unknown Function [uncultured bacterium]
MTDTLTKIAFTVDRSLFDITTLVRSQEPYGSFIVGTAHPLAARVASFDLLEDTCFKSYVSIGELISAEEKLLRIEKEGDVPLDVYCLRAILGREKTCQMLAHKWWELHGLHRPNLRSIDFPGTVVVRKNDQTQRHIFSIDYVQDTAAARYVKSIQPYETHDEGWGYGDTSLVFTKEFVKRHLL